MDKTVYLKKNKCCGCSACRDRCPVQAITMEYDEEGFIYPVIHPDLCISCGSCYQVCDFRYKKRPGRKYVPETYLFQNRDREKSQSGGAFIAFSDEFLDGDGSVYGCAGSGTVIRHQRASTVIERDRMRGSKYVQSEMQEVYRRISQDLHGGKKVLFTGTPCQAAAVVRYFQNSIYRDNLYVIDIVCHGVPSPMVFREYYNWLEETHKGNITEFRFKDISRVGWGGQQTESYLVNNQYCENHIWRDIFYDNVAMRECCGNCPYSTVNRKSDVTIGDAWQIEKRNPEMADEIGTSLVILHSDKGRKLFEKVNSGKKLKVDIDDYMQVNMFMPSRMNKRLRRDFLMLVYDDFDKALTEFYRNRHYNKMDRIYEKVTGRVRKLIYRGISRELACLAGNNGLWRRNP